MNSKQRRQLERLKIRATIDLIEKMVKCRASVEDLMKELASIYGPDEAYEIACAALMNYEQRIRALSR